MFQLMAGDKYVKVSDWQGSTRIHIWNYFKTQGNGGELLLPTKKGVALTIDEWKALKNVMAQIDAQIAMIEDQRILQKQKDTSEEVKRPKSLIPEECQYIPKLSAIANTFGICRDNGIPFKKLKELEPFDQ